MSLKAGLKVRRSLKHKSKYASQRIRTARNKHNAQARILRRKASKPQL